METEHHPSYTGVPESSDLSANSKGTATAPQEKYKTFCEKGPRECVMQEVFYIHSSKRSCKGNTPPDDAEGVNVLFVL